MRFTVANHVPKSSATNLSAFSFSFDKEGDSAAKTDIMEREIHTALLHMAGAGTLLRLGICVSRV